ncbi:DNA methyltransferase [Phenylobacterium sp.]|uniref:DNA methyltransferase n=1 Tax=Phenylobacterium sp. TaxID=1871053 RepID=UPI0025ED500A|nr:DNA methyltransferase [Phenylobacterium sp.]MCA3719797.1 restriction endonuclease [Phenylobacterium sp.]
MARKRIVVETSEAQKAALSERLELQGESFASWVEDQIEAELPRRAIADDITDSPRSVSELLDSARVFGALSAVDWSFTNDDTRYLTHDLHPYPAKFPPQIPAELIRRLSLPGDLVFDPFGGSGTTAVEAVRQRRRACSLDANPLSALIGRVKSVPLAPEAAAELDALRVTVDSYIANAGGKGANWAEGLIAKHAGLIPDIPNLEKWFCTAATGELALLRHLIQSLTSASAQDAALLSLARIVTRVSNQDSETRYVAHPKELNPGLTLRAFNESLKTVVRKLETSAPALAGACAHFAHGDARTSIATELQPASVDLIVTSPPYPNATDYHLYHRFRLFWLGWDPRHLGAVEIGSHLKHQRNGTDFDEYREDMAAVLEGCFTALQPGRYAVFIVGDAVFKGESFSTASALAAEAQEIGFEVVGTIDRPIHETRRSFAKPARRARSEQLLVLRRPNAPVRVAFLPPAYRMWPYEKGLRKAELAGLGFTLSEGDDGATELVSAACQPALWNARRAAFSTAAVYGAGTDRQPVWQKVLENGDADSATRKDPKYATHGIHPYKGKFYPQLAKSLLNTSAIECGATVLDPYCGSGTVPLECLLNGYRAYGVDMNPLAAKIARAKTGVLLLDHGLVSDAGAALIRAIEKGPKIPRSLEQFTTATHVELENWFPETVLFKINWILDQIRRYGDATLVDYLEVILSSIVREVSQQDPIDLRIRRRKEAISDAPVLELFAQRLSHQLMRLGKYWSIESRQPGARFTPVIEEGDSRESLFFDDVGLAAGSVDCVVTSPPYATALPYIDTDRLSLLAILGIPSAERSYVEEALTGSREIRRRTKEALEKELERGVAELPTTLIASLRHIQKQNLADNAGFRRQNMPALLLRYFKDIRSTLVQLSKVLKSSGRAYYVVGDSRTNVGGDWYAIETCRHISEIASDVGFSVLAPIDIDVTTERMLHMKNAITTNQVLIFERP